MARRHPPQPARRIGIGIDTSGYGHYAAFRRDDLQPADAELAFAESGPGYATLRQRLEPLRQEGDVIDLWSSVNGMSLRAAALDLVRTLHLEPTAPGTEKTNG